MALTKVPSNLDATIATTQAASDNSTNIATTAYVTTAIANLVDGAPSTLNTLDEIAAALNDDAALNTTLTNSIATKLPLAGGTMTGDVQVPGLYVGSTNTSYDFYNNGTSYLNGNVTVDANLTATGLLHVQTNDSTTNAAVESLRITNLSTGTTTTGFGGEIRFQAERNNGVNQNTGSIKSIAEVNSGADISSGLAFGTGTAGVISEAGRFTYTGDLLVGSPTNLDVLSGSPKIQVGDGSGHSSIQWYSGTGSVAGLYFGDATSGADRYSGYIEYRHNNNSMAFRAGGDTRLTIDSSGNVGIGTNNPNDILDIHKSNSQLRLTDTDDSKFVQFSYSGGKLIVRNNSTNTTVNQFTTLENGHFGIGTISPDSTLHVKGAADAYLTLEAGSTDGNTAILMQNSGGTQEAYILYDTDDNNMQFGVNSSERMRITSEGRLCLGFTAKQDDAFLSVISNGSEGIFNGVNSTNSYRRYYHTVSDGIHRFKGSANTATLTNAGSWSNASDIAYKEDIQDIPYGLDTVKALRPRTYKMKGTDLGDGEGLDQKIGFVAQEAELVVPEVVDGEDGEKTLVYGELTAVLVKAIQEQQTIIEDLKARIETLEG